MDRETVTALAQRFLDSDGGVFRGLRVADARLDSRREGCWVVRFSSKWADGSVIDSPPVVVVNDATGEIRFEEF